MRTAPSLLFLNVPRVREESNIFLESLGGIVIPIWLTNGGMGVGIIGSVAKLGIGTAGDDVEKVGNVAIIDEAGSLPISVKAMEHSL